MAQLLSRILPVGNLKCAENVLDVPWGKTLFVSTCMYARIVYACEYMYCINKAPTHTFQTKFTSISKIIPTT